MFLVKINLFPLFFRTLKMKLMISLNSFSLPIRLSVLGGAWDLILFVSGPNSSIPPASGDPCGQVSDEEGPIFLSVNGALVLSLMAYGVPSS